MIGIIFSYACFPPTYLWWNAREVLPHFLIELLSYCWKWKWSQSWPTLCDPMDCSLRGSSVHWIFKARVLEWVAISFSRGFSQPRDRTQVSHIANRRFTVWATKSPAFFVYLDNSLLLYVSIANIFSQSVFYLLILLILSFIEQKSESLMKSSLSIISFMDHAFDLHI